MSSEEDLTAIGEYLGLLIKMRRPWLSLLDQNFGGYPVSAMQYLNR